MTAAAACLTTVVQYNPVLNALGRLRIRLSSIMTYVY
jgi:hypothetical protein